MLLPATFRCIPSLWKRWNNGRPSFRTKERFTSINRALVSSHNLRIIEFNGLTLISTLGLLNPSPGVRCTDVFNKMHCLDHACAPYLFCNTLADPNGRGPMIFNTFNVFLSHPSVDKVHPLPPLCPILFRHCYIYWHINRSELFTSYILTIFKQCNLIDFNQYVQLPRWCRGSTLDCCARVPGFNSRLWQEFLWSSSSSFIWQSSIQMLLANINIYTSNIIWRNMRCKYKIVCTL